MKTEIYLLAEANRKAGYGHLFRMLGLAETIKMLPVQITFILNDSTSEAYQRISTSGFKFLQYEGDQFFKLLNENAIVILDGYSYPLEYQKAIKATKALLVVFDDYRFNETFCADNIINVAGGIPFDKYDKPFYCQVLYGPEYAIIQPPFLHKALDGENCNRSLFISLGGSDPNNYTGKILRDILPTLEDDSEINVVLGASYSHLDDISSIIDTSGENSIHVHQNLSTDEMATLMFKSTHAVTSASTVAYEFAFTRGNLYVVKTADNQEFLYNYLITNKLALPLEDFLMNIEDEQIVQNQRRVFTDSFIKRYHKLFSKLITESQIKIRKATNSDCQLLFNWANDQEVRSQSFNRKEIKWEDHKLWYSDKLMSGKALIFICLLNSEPVGQVRLDQIGGQHIIDYSIDSNYRGKGIGFLMLKKVLIHLQNIKIGRRYKAEVKESNSASLRCFEKLGFQTQSINNGIVQFELSV